MACIMQGVRDAWVRRVQFRHFSGGAVMLGDETSRITVSDCASFDPVSEIGGYRTTHIFHARATVPFLALLV